MSHHRHSVYCQSSALLLQFILDEFLEAATEVASIRGAYTWLESAIIRKRPLREIERLLSSVASNIAALTGSSRIHTQIYPWTPSKGSLGKLKHYSSLFAPQEPLIDPLVSELTVSVSKAYHGALEAREVLWQLRRGPLLLPEASTLFRLLNRVMDYTERVSQVLPKLALHYSDNENIVYFHILRREEFDRLYHRSYVADLMHEMFAGGLDELKSYLCDQFKQRGFDLPALEDQVNALA